MNVQRLVRHTCSLRVSWFTFAFSLQLIEAVSWQNLCSLIYRYIVEAAVVGRSKSIQRSRTPIIKDAHAHAHAHGCNIKNHKFHVTFIYVLEMDFNDMIACAPHLNPIMLDKYPFFFNFFLKFPSSNIIVSQVWLICLTTSCFIAHYIVSRNCKTPRFPCVCWKWRREAPSWVVHWER